MATSDVTEAPKSAHWHFPLWLLLIVLVAYPLSPGPVIKLFHSNPPSAIVSIYAPLEFLYGHVTAVQDFYDWYFKLWGIK